MHHKPPATLTGSGRLVGVGAGLILVLNVLVATGFPLDRLAHGAFYDRAPVWQDAARALAAVPPGASVAAQDMLVPRLTHRAVAGEISTSTGATDYLAAYVTAPLGSGQAINGGYAGLTRFVDQRLTGYAPVAYVHGWLLLRSRALPARPRPAALAPMTDAQATQVRAALGPWQKAHAARLAAATACVQAVGASAATGRAGATGASAATGRAGAARAAGATGTGAAPQPCRGLLVMSGVEAPVQTTLRALGPVLSPGCRELAGLAGLAAAQLSADLDAVRTVARRQPLDPVALQTAAATAGSRVAGNALGYVARLVPLCMR